MQHQPQEGKAQAPQEGQPHLIRLLSPRLRRMTLLRPPGRFSARSRAFHLQPSSPGGTGPFEGAAARFSSPHASNSREEALLLRAFFPHGAEHGLLPAPLSFSPRVSECPPAFLLLRLLRVLELEPGLLLAAPWPAPPVFSPALPELRLGFPFSLRGLRCP